jgi:hypothetical protein
MSAKLRRSCCFFLLKGSSKDAEDVMTGRDSRSFTNIPRTFIIFGKAAEKCGRISGSFPMEKLILFFKCEVKDNQKSWMGVT